MIEAIEKFQKDFYCLARESFASEITLFYFISFISFVI